MFSTGFVVAAYFAGISLVLDFLALIGRHMPAGTGGTPVYHGFHVLYRCGVLPVILTALIMMYGYFNFLTHFRIHERTGKEEQSGAGKNYERKSLTWKINREKYIL